MTLLTIIITDLKEVGHLYETMDPDNTSSRQKKSQVMPSKHHFFFVHHGTKCPDELKQVLKEISAVTEVHWTTAHNMQDVK